MASYYEALKLATVFTGNTGETKGTVGATTLDLHNPDLASKALVTTFEVISNDYSLSKI